MRNSPAAVECMCRAKKCNAWRLRWCRARGGGTALAVGSGRSPLGRSSEPQHAPIVAWRKPDGTQAPFVIGQGAAGGAKHRVRQGAREQKLGAAHSWYAQQIRGVFHGQHGVAIEAAIACHDGEPTGRHVSPGKTTPTELPNDSTSLRITNYFL